MSKFIAGILAAIIGIVVMVMCQFVFFSMEYKTGAKIAAFIGVLTITYSYKKLRKKSAEKETSAKLVSYNDKLSSYLDFEGFNEKEFNLLFCGYHIVYHGNIKAIVTFKDNKFHIKWEDTIRNLYFHEVVNTNQNSMNQINTVGDFFSSRFKKLHFSFDWDKLN